MSKPSTVRYLKVWIDDVVATDVSPGDQQTLMSFYEHIVKETARTRVREATYHTDDFAGVATHYLPGFTLTVRKEVHNEVPMWRGEFLRDEQRLEVLAMLDDY
ncbi:hypothetical protein OOT46_23055 [Aquabacterium sp. A7-Y]|uniref:hypothetical protein n=1 Tax=Aquabacterium sp. A7-Y TaxID=1349605 RepID=UPI00223D8D04|nr:hypothetical protein [Aquabacterium sp. A7-Y]MCW7540701.1 hypothetical protein [Aquabacterium sp. A7-Y]